MRNHAALTLPESGRMLLRGGRNGVTHQSVDNGKTWQQIEQVPWTREELLESIEEVHEECAKHMREYNNARGRLTALEDDLRELENEEKEDAASA